MKRAEDLRGVQTAAVGARVTPDGVSYRIWAPDQPEMAVVVERGGATRRLPLAIEDEGYWSAFDPNGAAGDLYRFARADGRLLPDVASRYQPLGVHGPSECIDPSDYHWRCDSWTKPAWVGQTIYEMHVGTMTPGGTFRAAIEKLDHLRELGVDAVELMPVADFAGNRNWGYDGVALYAPARCYGRPDDLRALVDAAHAHRLAVILDVVYNHLGPAGNYLSDFSPAYFREDQHTPWGRTFNLDEARSRPIRDFLVGNAAYWLDEFRFDGLRLDATHAIPDRSPRHLLAEIAEAVHARGGFVIAEDERNQARLLDAPDDDGLGLDAAWADDFHHEVRVALTGRQESYFSGYAGTAAELASTLMHGWAYRGQAYRPWAGRPRGSACQHLPASAFITCIENHDQVGNRPDGRRLEHLVTPGQFRAASMLLCLSPYVPMLFMGQEWAATSPFLYFTDHGGELGEQIAAGRRREFEQQGAAWGAGEFPEPEDPATFLRSKLDWAERGQTTHAAVLALYRVCLEQRRMLLTAPVLRRERWRVVHFAEFIAVRYLTDAGERMLLATLRPGGLPPAALPDALQPPAGRRWQIVLHSEERRFGGGQDWRRLTGWKIIGPAAAWLAAIPEDIPHAAD